MRSKLIRIALFTALAAFYVAGASIHGTRVNTSKARGDQSGYLWDGQNVRKNWEGERPPILIGERNRMPVYAGFLALFWDPATTNEVYFEQAKKWNIYLSVGLLAVLAALFAYFLPPLPATNLTIIIAFGYWVFKAGYVQAELLFYFLFFVAFLLFIELLRKARPTARSVPLAAAAGAAAAVAHLTKASVLPLTGIFLAVFLIDGAVKFRAQPKHLLQRGALAAVVLLSFLLALWPYIHTNKRVFGRYFYNVNTTFYVWYDDWPRASVGTILHGDGVGWPKMPAEELPSGGRYWREHTMRQILERIGGGFWNMIDRSYHTYWYFTYLVLYLAFALVIAITRRAAFRDAVHRHRATLWFLVMYAAAYSVGIAFYHPVSGTGTSRFLLAHLLPLFFVLSLFLASPSFRTIRWDVTGTGIEVRHFHLMISIVLGFDLAFVIWPRLMTTYGGF
jgi:hypothetical protein